VGLRLIGLNQVADALRIALAMSVTGDGIGAAGRFHHDFGPENARGNVHRRDLRHRDTFLIASEEPSFYARDSLRTNDQFGWEEEISLGPSRSGEGFCRGRIHRVERLRGQRSIANWLV